LLLILFLTTF